MSHDLIVLCARFVDADSGAPLVGEALRVRFFDSDAIADDFLGETGLGTDGVARIVISPARYRSGLKGAAGEAFGELEPDIYCEVREGDKVLYRSAVKWDIEPTPKDPVPGLHRTLDLGTYQFRRGEGLQGDGIIPFPPAPPLV